MTAPGSRIGWRLRALVRRHLAVHGGWYAVERARATPGPDIAPTLTAFLAGQPAPGTDAALVERLSAELTAEWEQREVASESPLGRITALARRAGIGRAGADLVTVLAGAALDRTYAWFCRSIDHRGEHGGDAGGLAVWLATDLVDPDGRDVAAVAAAWRSLGELGVVTVAAGRATLTAPLASWIGGGEPALPAGVVEHGGEAVQRRNRWRTRILPATDAIDAQRVVVVGGRGMGAGWIAAARGRVVLELEADVVRERAAEVAAAALVRDAVLLVDAGADVRELAARLARLPVAAVVAVRAEVDALALAALVGALGASTVELADATRTDRIAWWRALLAETWMYGAGSGVSAEQLAAYPLPLETIFELSIALHAPTPVALDRAARIAAASPLDTMAERLAPRPHLEDFVPGALGAHVDELRRHLDAGTPGRVFLETETPAAAAAVVCSAAGVELFELTAASLLAAPEGVVRRAATVMALAAARGAAVLVTGLEALRADADALAALFSQPRGVIILPGLPAPRSAS